MKPPPKFLSRLAAGVVALTALAIGVLTSSIPASALTVTAHAYGYVSATDGRWLGSHRLGDGNLGLCLQVEKLPPEGTDVTYDHGSTLGWYSRDDAARLAYLARASVLSTDAVEAAAAQLAAWSITGLDGHDDAFYAQRANGDAEAVLARARQMRAQMDSPGGASRSVSARLTLAPVPNSGGAGATVRGDLLVDFLAGGVTTLDPDQHTGTITLTGATFDDGSTRMTVQNGRDYAVHPIGGQQSTHVTASVVFSELRFGNDFWVAKAPSTIQTLLVQQPRQAEARASAEYDVRSDLPFFPAVQTSTSEQVVAPGAELHDDLQVKLADAPAELRAPSSGARLDHWGTYVGDDGTEQPIPVTVQSTLHGPFATPPTPAPSAPDGSGVVCTVEVLVDRGPGAYRTPECELPSAGYYVWTDTIDPAETPPEKGGARVGAWASSFGVAAEVTQVASPPVSPPPTVPPVPPIPPVQPPPPTHTPTPTPSPTTTPPTASEVTPVPNSPAVLASTGGSNSLSTWASLAGAVTGGGAAATVVAGAWGRLRRRRR